MIENPPVMMAVLDPEFSPSIPLSIAVLVFGLLVIGAVALVLIRKKESWTQRACQIASLAIIVCAGLFLVGGAIPERYQFPGRRPPVTV